MFNLIYESKYGPTVESDNPKLDAYKQIHYNKVCGYTSVLIVRDGCYTVQVVGLADITFEPVEDAIK